MSFWSGFKSGYRVGFGIFLYLEFLNFIIFRFVCVRCFLLFRDLSRFMEDRGRRLRFGEIEVGGWAGWVRDFIFFFLIRCFYLVIL